MLCISAKANLLFIVPRPEGRGKLKKIFLQKMRRFHFTNTGKFNEKIIPCFSWFIIVFVIVCRYFHFPFSATPSGDEPFYTDEINYLVKYGAYNSLAQGTSFLYLSLVFIFSKIFFISFLVSARILSAIFFIVCTRLFLKCLGHFTNVSFAEKYIGLSFFCVISFGWVMKGLPDFVSCAFMLASFNLVAGAANYKRALLAGVLLFIGFAIKPVTVFAFPALAVFLFFNQLKTTGWRRNALKTLLFSVGFVLCFICYHIPGYLAYHKIMLEDKNHVYAGDKRIESATTWNERNVYFELYNVHHKINKWAVTWEEVDSFKQQHPEINLNITAGQYARANPAAWMAHVGYNVFLALPYSINHGFFFAKWAVINKFIKNSLIIKLVSLVLIISICLYEWKFIKQNFLLLLAPFLFYLGVGCYIVTQLEDNWLLFCLPFLALPVVKFLARYIPVFLLLLLQFIYLLV